jgi:restriction endonuclease S subunit
MSPETMLGEHATSSRMRAVMHSGQVLLSTTRPTRKAAAVVPPELDGQICSTGFAILECSDEIVPSYLFHILRTDLLMYEFKRRSSGSSYPALNKDMDLPLVKIPVPPKDIQLEIVSEISAVMERSEKIEMEIESKRKEAKALFELELLDMNP